MKENPANRYGLLYENSKRNFFPKLLKNYTSVEEKVKAFLNFLFFNKELFYFLLKESQILNFN